LSVSLAAQNAATHQLEDFCMWKLLVGFVVFAALALFVLMKGGGNIDLSGEKHDVSAPHEAPSAPAPAASVAVDAASAPASAASN